MLSGNIDDERENMTDANIINAKKCVHLGVPGSFSHLALTSMFPDCTPVGVPTFGEIIKGVQDGTYDLGVLPVENSETGRIPDVHRMLREMDLAICFEEVLPIEHCLIGSRDINKARENKGEGLKILSHPQGFHQCSSYLEKNFPKATHVPDTDTAAAVSHAVTQNDEMVVAIGSEQAAMIYSGKVLARKIANKRDNYTRFVFLTRHENWTPNGRENLTFLSFTVGNEPNALCEALSVLGTNNINLVRLEMYGASSGRAEPTFNVDAGIGVKNDTFRKAMKEFEGRVKSIKILGSCVASQDRSAESGFLPVA